ncbi:unnamed protein product [Mesocestoides corti]|uniref:Large ribosomal subunit protein mL64 n=1 Tax=Mesocestoides corti TaxID=53468 RepID=A0A0R3U3J3_MESCO|nr:unnamed protein product [Mesocestoides corti]
MLSSSAAPCSKFTFLLRTTNRGKKYYPGWRNPFNLTDHDNLSKAAPSITEQWEADWASSKVVPPVLKAFDISRLPHHLVSRNKREPPPVKYDHERHHAYQRRLFGLYGLSSGVNPCELFDSKEDLEREKEIKKLLEPEIEEFKRNQAEAIAMKAREEEQRVQKITANLQRLPEMLAKYRATQEKKALEAQTLEAKKRQLLEDARDRFGYYVDRHDPKFIRLVQEKEEAEKLSKKASKKK